MNTDQTRWATMQTSFGTLMVMWVLPSYVLLISISKQVFLTWSGINNAIDKIYGLSVYSSISSE